MTVKELKKQIENLKDDTIVLISINDVRALDIELIKHSKCGRKPSDENCTFIKRSVKPTGRFRLWDVSDTLTLT